MNRLILVISLLLLFEGCKQNPSLPSFAESYDRTDTKPFGTKVLYQALESFFFQNNIKVKRTHFRQIDKEFSDTGSVYISISPQILFTEKERDALLQFVYRGNTVFLSSNIIDEPLLKHLGLTQLVNRSNNWRGMNSDTRITGTFSLNYPDLVETNYQYRYLPMIASFNGLDVKRHRVLGLNEKKQPNFLLAFHGKGRIFVHTEPRAFGNYFLLKEQNIQYVKQSFGLIQNFPGAVIWDDYYRKRYSRPEKEPKSGLGILLQYPALRWAFWLLLALFIVFLLSGLRRKQRIVPVVPSNKNTSVAFTETIANLYLKEHNNRDLLEKIITYFFDYIRSHYLLNPHQVNEEFIYSLSRKADVSEGVTRQVFSSIQQLQLQTMLSDEELLSFNKLIEQFFKQQ